MQRFNLIKTILVLLPAIVFFSCQKTYTREEAMDLLKSDYQLAELTKLKADNRAALNARFKSVATPQAVKKYMQAKAKGDQQYLDHVRNQILSTHMDNIKKEAQLYALLYKKYITKFHMPREEFRNIVNAANKKTGKSK